jgi:exodeoxyribonuclease VII large subunit
MIDTVYTITELTRIIKRNLEENPDLSGIWIIGEISNLTYHSSGHIYFTLKDENAVLSSVFFKYQNKKLSFRLEDGMSVFALGGINVFEKRGSYQFIVSEVKLEGIGELQKRIEQLKKKLLAEGYCHSFHDVSALQPLLQVPQ